MKWFFRKRWRILKHWWFTKILGWVSFEIAQQRSPECKVVYQCYGYVCQVDVTITIDTDE